MKIQSELGFYSQDYTIEALAKESKIYLAIQKIREFYVNISTLQNFMI